MKAVALVCLLSLSMCLTQAAEPITEKPTSLTPPAQHATETASKTAAPTKPAAPSTDKTQNATQPADNDKTPTEIKIVTTEEPKKASADKASVAPTVDNNTTKAENKTEAPKETTVVPKNETAAKTTTVKPENATTHAPATKPTEAPTVTDKPIVQARGFDGPSFIGGIILTLGLLAIGFMGFKYYKNQTERNYHTL